MTLLGINTAVTGKMSSQGKLNWYNLVLDNMIKIICSNKQPIFFFLIVRNQKCAADINIFAKVSEKVNEKAAPDG